MEEKIFTVKQVYILVFVIVVGIAFIETSTGAIWVFKFWREFLLKVIIYGGIAEFIVLLSGSSWAKK